MVTLAFALYIKIESRICFYFPKSVSGIETLELRQRDEAGVGGVIPALPFNLRISSLNTPA